MMSSPTAFEPVNETEATSGCSTRAGPTTSPMPGRNAEGVVGHAGVVQQLHQPPGDPRRLLGRLEHDRVAGDELGRHHPHRDGQREVPRRDHDGDAARLVREPVGLAGHVEDGAALAEAQRLAPVVLAEVDGLAHLGVGLGDRLARLAGHQADEGVAPAAEPGRRPEEHRGALVGGACRPPGERAVGRRRPPAPRRRGRRACCGRSRRRCARDPPTPAPRPLTARRRRCARARRSRSRCRGRPGRAARAPAPGGARRRARSRTAPGGRGRWS